MLDDQLKMLIANEGANIIDIDNVGCEAHLKRKQRRKAPLVEIKILRLRNSHEALAQVIIIKIKNDGCGEYRASNQSTATRNSLGHRRDATDLQNDKVHKSVTHGEWVTMKLKIG